VLTELRIRNFAIIEEVALEFSDGFTVLTGETGAGKSILVDAVDLLVGGRASTELIRTGVDEAEVAGVFAITADGPVAALLKTQDLIGSDEQELILRRILSRSGRHRVYINGRPAPLGLLQSLRGLLVDLHGQHEQQSLFKPSVQEDLLDAFGGLTDLRQQYACAFETMRLLEKRLAQGRQSTADLQAREDLLRYQVEEIAAAQPRPGEDQSLEHGRLLLSEGRRLAELAQQIYGPLYSEEPSILDALRSVGSFFKEISAIDKTLTGDRDRVENATAELSDIAHRLREYRDRLEYDPDRLDKIEERLDLLHRLMKKYGGSLDEVARRGETAARELGELETLEADLAGLATQLDQARGTAQKQAESLSQKRAKAASDLEKRLEAELKALQMDRARVRITVKWPANGETTQLTSTGIDQVEFLFSANLGEPAQPLIRIASGGELSRVMLALKTVLAGMDRVPVLVFDEVDAGIGGAVAEVVGKRLRQLSKHRHQVFCITHLAPIAVQAQHHFAVSKAVKGGRTVTNVVALDSDGRVEEIARMLGGATITPKVRATAKEMLKTAQQR
jgi:DNA repair protein RecN (Recombination protein N)